MKLTIISSKSYKGMDQVKHSSVQQAVFRPGPDSLQALLPGWLSLLDHLFHLLGVLMRKLQTCDFFCEIS